MITAQKHIETFESEKAAASAIREKVKSENREPTDEEQEAYNTHVANAKAAKDKAVKAQQSAIDYDALGDAPTGDVDPTKTGGDIAPQFKAATGITAGVTVKGERLSPGDAFVKSGVFAQLLKQYPNGIPKDARVQLDAVQVADSVKALLTDPHLSPELRITAPAQLQVIDLLQAITIVDDAPDTVKVFRAAFTDVAAVVAEGGTKPEATLTWTPETIVLDTIAQHMPVTNQTLTHNALMRSFIETFMVNGVRAKVAANVGTMLAAAAGLQTQAFDTDLRTTIRRAITKAGSGGASIGAVPTGILISANDAETIDLEALANVQLQAGQGYAQMAELWRLPLVVSYQLADGFAYVGDLRQIHLFTNGRVDVMSGWIDQQFIENSQTLLAETEADSTVLVAPAIVKADLTAV